MPRRDVELSGGEYYHLYNRGHNRGCVFRERANYAFFLRRLSEYLVPVAKVVAYCLMPTHYHLVVLVQDNTEALDGAEASTGSGVSRAMQRLSISYTRAMNRRYRRVGALFQGAFRAKHVHQEGYLMHLSRYVHLNPVFAGLVDHPQDWGFSSYQDYIGVREGRLPHPEAVLSQFGSRDAYQAFVEAYLPEQREVIASLLFD